jgi:hypothetical protein
MNAADDVRARLMPITCRTDLAAGPPLSAILAAPTFVLGVSYRLLPG